MYTYNNDYRGNQQYKNKERNSINEEVNYLKDNKISVNVVEKATKNDLIKAFSDSKAELIVTSGHGSKDGKILTNDDLKFGPEDVMKLNVGEKLKTVIFENCYQGGSDVGTNDNEKNWENAFGGNVDAVGWQGTTNVGETIRFNNDGVNDRQDRNLMNYCEDVVNRNEL